MSIEKELELMYHLLETIIANKATRTPIEKDLYESLMVALLKSSPSLAMLKAKKLANTVPQNNLIAWNPVYPTAE